MQNAGWSAKADIGLTKHGLPKYINIGRINSQEQNLTDNNAPDGEPDPIIVRVVLCGVPHPSGVFVVLGDDVADVAQLVKDLPGNGRRWLHGGRRRSRGLC